MNDQSIRFTIAGGTAAFLLISTACMVGPKYRLPSAPVSPVFREELPSGWKNSQPADGAAKGEWWTAYTDPGLDALEVQVSISNQNVLAAAAQFRAAKSGNSRGSGRPVPDGYNFTIRNALARQPGLLDTG
jgi:outer membrane protein TolC